MKDKVKGKEKYLKRTEFPTPKQRKAKTFQYDPTKDRGPIMTKELSKAFDDKRAEERKARKEKAVRSDSKP